MRPASMFGAEQVGGVFGAAGDLFRSVDQRDVVADVVRGHDVLHWNGLVHGATPFAWRAAAYFTASMIFT